MPEDLSLEDRLDLHELAARYGNVIDRRAWGELSDVFTDDASFEVRGFSDTDARHDGLEAIRAMLASSRHPVAHHVTNVEVTTANGATHLFFKVVGPGARGRVGSADYRDTVRREPGGWRIARHIATLRRPTT